MMLVQPSEVENLARLLARIVNETNNINVIDRIANAPTRELLVFYISQALRDYVSLDNKGESKAKINLASISRLLDRIEAIDDRKELLELQSLIAAKALAYLSIQPSNFSSQSQRQSNGGETQ